VSAVGLENIEHTVQLTLVWIYDLDTWPGWDNKHRSYRLLRTVLQAVRDRLPVNEAVELGAQLPTLLRGVYYERWRPATTPVRQRRKARVHRARRRRFRERSYSLHVGSRYGCVCAHQC
jgi:uncharacterized protein (DUF2267 family)